VPVCLDHTNRKRRTPRPLAEVLRLLHNGPTMKTLTLAEVASLLACPTPAAPADAARRITGMNTLADATEGRPVGGLA